MTTEGAANGGNLNRPTRPANTSIFPAEIYHKIQLEMEPHEAWITRLCCLSWQRFVDNVLVPQWFSDSRLLAVKSGTGWMGKYANPEKKEEVMMFKNAQFMFHCFDGPMAQFRKSQAVQSQSFGRELMHLTSCPIYIRFYPDYPPLTIIPHFKIDFHSQSVYLDWRQFFNQIFARQMAKRMVRGRKCRDYAWSNGHQKTKPLHSTLRDTIGS